MEDKIIFTEPTLVKSGVEKLIGGDYLTVSDLVINLNYAITDIEELSSIPKNTLLKKGTNNSRKRKIQKGTKNILMPLWDKMLPAQEFSSAKKQATFYAFYYKRILNSPSAQ